MIGLEALCNGKALKNAMIRKGGSVKDFSYEFLPCYSPKELNHMCASGVLTVYEATNILSKLNHEVYELAIRWEMDRKLQFDCDWQWLMTPDLEMRVVCGRMDKGFMCDHNVFVPFEDVIVCYNTEPLYYEDMGRYKEDPNEAYHDC